jgi:adenosine deaminase
VHAIDDPALMAELKQKQIPLEVCPSSNVALGIYPSIAEHPVKKLIDAGLCVTINSDDPPLFGTNLTREYLHLHRTFGLSAAELAQLSWNGLRHAFLDGGERQALEGRFREGMSEVGISNFE